jgi:hypothetical protein
MSEPTQPRYGVDPYLDWVKKEGLPIAEDYGIDLFSVATAEWPRFGVKGAAVHLGSLVREDPKSRIIPLFD